MTFMGKGKRTRISAEAERELLQQKQTETKLKKRRNRITATLVSAGIVAVGLICVFGSIGYTSLNNSGYFLRNKTAISTEDYEINASMVQYLYNSTVRNFEANNSSYLTEMGLDTSMDLRLQTCAYDEKISWHQYFLNSTQTQYEEIITLAQAASDEGMELSTSDYDYIDESITYFDSLAEEEGITTREYIDKNYGTQVSIDDIRNCIEMTQLASNYKTKYDEALKYTQQEIDDYWSENKGSFLTCDYISVTVPNGATGEESDAELKALNNSAKAQAEKLADAESAEEFEENLTSFFEAELKKSNPSISNNDLKSNIESLLNNCTAIGAGYDVSTDAGEWLFDAKRAAGDTTVIAEESGYTAYCLATPAIKDTSETKNVRHILISNDDYEDTNDAKREANRLLKEWRNGDKTEESFAELAKQHSSDTGSSQVGGLYENVTEGTMVDSFNDWIFSSARKQGDVDVIGTDYGWHVMYFVGDGYKAWQSKVVSAMKSDDYSKKLENLKEKYQPKVKESALNIINVVLTKSAENTTSAVSK